MVSIVFFQFVHFNYYGSWIFPMEYVLFFTEFDEVVKTFETVLYMAYIPFILSAILWLGIYFTLKNMSDERLKIPYLSYILIGYLIFLPVKIYLKDSKRGSRPDVERNVIRNTLWTFNYLIGNILPKKFFGDDKLTQPIEATPPIETKNPDVNVIMIMGESLTVKYMSLYDYNISTTPYLDSLKNDDNFMYKKTISSGLMTAVSLPSFFNMIYRADSMPQILSTNTCLFKMASNNGFETHFYSSQSRIGLSALKSYMCTRWIDNYKDGSDKSHDKNKGVLDNYLLENLKNVDLTKPNFIVLHQFGSHSPYEKRYPKEFDKFKQNPDSPEWKNNLNSYQNSILYTDYIISKIIEIIKQKTDKKTYLIFTSDHGENVGLIGERGHGNFSREMKYSVPFFIYALNGAKPPKKLPTQGNYMSHYEISKILAHYLGYNTNNMCKSENGFFICGQDIRGLSGILNIKFDENGTMKKKRVR